MDLKDLSISFDLIPVKLGEFSGNSVNSQIKGNATHFSFVKDGFTCLLIAFKTKKGTVTLQCAGAHKEISEQAARYIVNNTHPIVQKNFSCSIKGYDKDKLNLLSEYLIEECGARVEEEFKEINGSAIEKLIGRQGDILTFTLYNTGTLLVQGRPVVLAAELVQYLSEEESIPQNELFKHLADIFETTMTPREAIKGLTDTYPFAYEYAGSNLRKILSTAISMRGIPLVLEDYSVISFPALRALESFMKKTVVDACDQPTKDFGDFFDLVNQAPRKYKLKPAMQAIIGCQTTCHLLEECYSYYNPHRHGTFHAGNIDGDIRLIPNRTDALEISSTALGLINNYSKILLEKK